MQRTLPVLILLQRAKFLKTTCQGMELTITSARDLGSMPCLVVHHLRVIALWDWVVPLKLGASSSLRLNLNGMFRQTQQKKRRKKREINNKKEKEKRKQKKRKKKKEKRKKKKRKKIAVFLLCVLRATFVHARTRQWAAHTWMRRAYETSLSMSRLVYRLKTSAVLWQCGWCVAQTLLLTRVAKTTSTWRLSALPTAQEVSDQHFEKQFVLALRDPHLLW